MRCTARTPSKLDAEIWRDQVEVITGDVLDPTSLVDAFDGMEIAYYLVHSIGADADREQRDRTAAENFRDAAQNAGLLQIIYLGGLGTTLQGVSLITWQADMMLGGSSHQDRYRPQSCVLR